jgi:hypothetical protein
MLNFFVEMWNSFVDFSWQLVLSVFDMLKDLFYWLMEQLFTVGILILEGVGSLISGLSVAQYISALPSQTAHTMSIIGISEAMGMVITCLGIRFLLQLIPFVRWGS